MAPIAIGDSGVIENLALGGTTIAGMALGSTIIYQSGPALLFNYVNPASDNILQVPAPNNNTWQHINIANGNVVFDTAVAGRELLFDIVTSFDPSPDLTGGNNGRVAQIRLATSEDGGGGVFNTEWLSDDPNVGTTTFRVPVPLAQTYSFWLVAFVNARNRRNNMIRMVIDSCRLAYSVV